MKTEYRIALLLTAFLGVAPLVWAQNLNPTVEVTNVYQAGAADIHKPQLEMAVPDSLLRFDLDFDYEVFDNPYRGAYSFQPYMLDLQPAKDAWRGHKLFVKAGAGYSPHPQAAFIYSPELPGRFQMSVYGDHTSYFGKYASMNFLAPEGYSPGTFSAHPETTFVIDDTGDAPWSGYDMRNRFGVEGRARWEKSLLTVGAAYDGFAAKDFRRTLRYHSGEVTARIRSTDDKALFSYDAGFRGRLAREAFQAPDSSLVERYFILSGAVGRRLQEGYGKVLLDYDLSTYYWSGLLEDQAGRIVLTPHWVMDAGKVRLDAGVRMDFMLPGAVAFSDGKFKASPQINASVDLLGERLTLFGFLTGGTRMNTWTALSEHAHFFCPSWSYRAEGYSLAQAGFCPRLRATVTRFDAGAGVRGYLGAGFHYLLRGGYAVYDNQAVMAVHLQEGYRDGVAVQSGAFWGFKDTKTLYADLELLWQGGERVTLDADLHYRKTSFRNDLYDYFPRFPFIPFADPCLSGDLTFRYHFSSRLHAGLRLDASTNRRGVYLDSDAYADPVVLPGWIDPGIIGGYRLNNRFSFWLESGNLLGQAIQRIPLYAEKGPWFSVGVTLTL